MIYIKSEGRKFLRIFFDILTVIFIILILYTAFLKYSDYLKNKKEISEKYTEYIQYKIKAQDQRKDISEFLGFLSDNGLKIISFEYNRFGGIYCKAFSDMETGKQIKTKYEIKEISKLDFKEHSFIIFEIKFGG